MAIVLNTQVTLNPNNQIAHLADATGLVGSTQYVINGTYLQPNTRFVYLNELDVTLSLPPVGVPGANTTIPCDITTVPLPAPVPPPTTYPYVVKDRLLADDLNHSFENSPGPSPPASGNGTANLGKAWLDTSVSPPQFRMCAVPVASLGYVVNEWFTLGPIQGGQNLSSVYMPLAGDSTKIGALNVTGNLSTGGALNVTGASTLSGGLTVTGNESVGGSITAGGNITASGNLTTSNNLIFSANILGPGGYTLMGPGGTQASVINIDSANSNFAGSLSVSGSEVVYGNFQANGQIYTPGNVIGANSVQSNGVYFQNNSGWFYTPQNFFAGGAVGVGGSTGIYWTNYGGWMYCPVGMWCSNINTGGINMNGGGLSGCGNIAGASEGSIGGVVMPGDSSISCGPINCGPINSNSNISAAGAVFVNGLYWQNNGGYMYCPQWVMMGGILQVNGGGDAIQAWNGNIMTKQELSCMGRGVEYANIGGNGFNFRWDSNWGAYIRIDNVTEFLITAYSDERLKTDIAPRPMTA